MITMPATNHVYATYQEIYDVNTELNKLSLIGIHTPIGAKPRQMLAGFFQQYRKYKYLGCSIVGTPCATLPLNLQDIDVNAGESGTNPRDIWNPILFHGCHGDNLNSALNSIYKGTMNFDGTTLGKDDFSITTVPDAGTGLTWEQIYYRMLQDPSFRKMRMNQGFTIDKLHPMVYNMASLHQILPNEGVDTVGDFVYDNDGNLNLSITTSGKVAKGDGYIEQVYPKVLTNHLVPLSWLDTRQILNSSNNNVNPAYTVLPKQMMGLVILPPAYRSKTAMRIVITHRFEFKDFNTSLTLESANEYYNWLTQIAGSKSIQALNNTLECPTADITLVSDTVS